MDCCVSFELILALTIFGIYFMMALRDPKFFINPLIFIFMSNKKTKALIRAIANLDAADQLRVLRASDEDLPAVLQSLGLSLPSNNWLLIVAKIVLYAAGLILAGIGTSVAAQTLIY